MRLWWWVCHLGEDVGDLAVEMEEEFLSHNVLSQSHLGLVAVFSHRVIPLTRLRANQQIVLDMVE